MTASASAAPAASNSGTTTHAQVLRLAQRCRRCLPSAPWPARRACAGCWCSATPRATCDVAGRRCRTRNLPGTGRGSPAQPARQRLQAEHAEQPRLPGSTCRNWPCSMSSRERAVQARVVERQRRAEPQDLALELGPCRRASRRRRPVGRARRRCRQVSSLKSSLAAHAARRCAGRRSAVAAQLPLALSRASGTLRSSRSAAIRVAGRGQAAAGSRPPPRVGRAGGRAARSRRSRCRARARWPAAGSSRPSTADTWDCGTDSRCSRAVTRRACSLPPAAGTRCSRPPGRP